MCKGISYSCFLRRLVWINPDQVLDPSSFSQFTHLFAQSPEEKFMDGDPFYFYISFNFLDKFIGIIYFQFL
jgi:hypothetical protein